ncbi:MAG: amino acid ABC transporter permease [Rhodovibrionaceae bacterium]|nr:amino acid ABC transporter permease [Rhodovibrionaceae bacterium]
MPPPRTEVGVIGWLRKNLFNSWFNSLMTLLAIWILYKFIPPIVDWFIISAQWADAPPEVCKEVSGACWPVIYEKYRLVIFGRYPYEEHWRPLIGVLILIGVVGFSTNRKFWRPWLGLVWLGGLAAFFAIMWGGFLGMKLVPNNLWGGLPLTLLLGLVGVTVAFPISILLALGRRSQNVPLIRALCVGSIELIRGVPLITLLFMASFMLPLFMPTGVSIDEVLRAQVAIILFTAAYLAEVIRGGLQAIPKGQYEAADALGLNYWQAQRKIILPQALKISIPPIVNTFIGIFKDTSLVAIVSLTDLLFAARSAIADPEWRAFFVEIYIFIAVIYFCFTFFMSRYSQYLERVLDTGHGARR